MISDSLLLDIAAGFGTPTYVYDLDEIKAQYQKFTAAFLWENLTTCYAMKANYNPDILKTFKALGASIDAVSPGDLYLSRACGFDTGQIIYTANNITDDEMNEISGTGVLMNIGSLSRLEKYAKAHPRTRVCLRFNPEVVDGAHENIKTGGDETKFGILLRDAARAVAITRAYGLKVAGLHEHTGSGLTRPDSIVKAMENIFTVATPENFPDLEFLDFGGGFKVAYEPDEPDLDIRALGKTVTERFTGFCESFGRRLGLWFEPGKYLTARAGTLLMEVNTIKQNRSRTICGTNSGFPQLIRPMFYDAWHTIDNLSNPDGPPETYDICGNICETGDRFAAQRPMSRIRETDILAVRDAGAYCYAMGGVYNLRPMPAEVVVENQVPRLSRRRLSPRELADMILDR